MKRFLGALLAVVILGSSVTEAVAATFDPNFVISDIEATETASFNAAGVQAFLTARGSGLATYRTTDVDGVVRSAADIIMGASERNRISARLLLALLQREQSLLLDPNPTQKQLDWATGYGVCDSCSMDDPALAKYRGFATQVDDAAGNFRYLLENGASLTYLRAKDKPTVIDGITVTPRTAATAHLYNYTPHLLAQENFWNIWQTYFVRHYPSGTLVTAMDSTGSPQGGLSGTWLIKFGERRKIASRSVLVSRFDSAKVVTVSANDLLAYNEGAPINFANYSLIRSPRGTVFLLVDDERRGIVSKEVFRKLGFNPGEVTDASWEDINAYREGTNITQESVYPFGALLREPTKGGVYFVQNGIKHPIPDRTILSLYFKNRRVKAGTTEELNSYPNGEPIKLRDGELVREASAATVYVISDGQRLPITSGEVFEKQGWRWENVVLVPDKVLELHEMGTAFDSGNPSTALRE